MLNEATWWVAAGKCGTENENNKKLLNYTSTKLL